MKKILIGLDFDGVVHNYLKTNFENLPVVKDLINSLENQGFIVDVVVTSNWRAGFSLDKLKEKLNLIKDNIVGITPFAKDENYRYIEFLDFIENRKANDVFYDFHFCLDDNEFLFKDHEHLLYLVDYKSGLTKKDNEIILNQIKNSLNKKFKFF